MRTKKIFLNMFFDIMPYLLIGIVGLIKVNYLIKYIGDVGNGYYQFITQVISYVFLAQAGFSEAVTYSLYKPFADNNKKDINKIYSGARYIFKIIGLIILGIIFVVSLGLYFYYGNDPYRNSAIICFAVISVSYLIAYFGKTQTYGAILIANQEKYLYSIVFNSMKLICDILTIFVIVKFRSLESIAILIFIIKVIEEIVMRIFIKRKYGWLEEVEEKNTSMAKMTKDLVWLQIGYLVLNNIDAILLMFFVGPVAVSIYTSYNYILRYLGEVTSRANLASVSSFGNVFAKKENNRAFKLFKELQGLFIIIAISVCLTFMVGIRSFIMIWIKDINYILNYKTIILFTLTLFFTIIYYPLLSIVNANGLFKDNKKHTFICAFVNVLLSVILIQYYEINGVLMGTIISFIINIYLKCSLLKKKVFTDLRLLKLLIPYISSSLVFIVLAYLSKYAEYYLLFSLDSILLCVVMLGLIFLFVLVITFTVMYLTNPYTVNLLDRIVNLLKRNRLKNNKKIA